MLSTPLVTFREKMTYLAVRTKVRQQDIPATLPPLLPQVYAWMKQHDITPGGPPFFLYRSMDNDKVLVAEAGVPVSAGISSNGYVFSDALPEGKYATILHTGDYKNMMEGHMALEAWVVKKGLKEKHCQGSYGTIWCRAEFYLNDPADEPDPAKWITEIVMLLETE
ncbi:MAG: GyrI-like domain-containing protein [Chitinophagaceae bacterium]|nr:GyrI-like domain-containing protein [Chitinophagaceae bacterium]